MAWTYFEVERKRKRRWRRRRKLMMISYRLGLFDLVIEAVADVEAVIEVVDEGAVDY